MQSLTMKTAFYINAGLVYFGVGRVQIWTRAAAKHILDP